MRHARSLWPLVHGFSGELRSEDDQTAFAAAIGVAGLPLMRLSQVHGDAVVDAGAALAAPGRLPGDALVCDRPGLAIAVATADCVPLLLADAEAGVAAAIHAGWRGMVARVILRAAEAMVARGAKPERITAAIGPAVQGTCYEVGDEVRAAYTHEFAQCDAWFDGRRLDLIAVARAELERAGLPAGAIQASTDCTHCQPALASHRRQGLDRGTNLSVIAIPTNSAVLEKED